MHLAAGRRPPSVNKRGIWPECGSDRREGGREGGREGSHGPESMVKGREGRRGLHGGSIVSLKQMEFLFGFSFSHTFFFKEAVSASGLRVVNILTYLNPICIKCLKKGLNPRGFVLGLS